MNRFDKCRFCLHYDDFEGCKKYITIVNKKCFAADKEKIIETAKDYKMSVADIVALITLD